MIRIEEVKNKTPTVCKWCKRLPMEGSKTYLVEIEGLYKEPSRFIICNDCLREVKRESTKALKESHE